MDYTLLNYQFFCVGAKPFPCTHCDKRFSDKGNLRQHLKKRHNPRLHRCPVCSQGFPGKRELKTHLTSHKTKKTKKKLKSTQRPIDKSCDKGEELMQIQSSDVIQGTEVLTNAEEDFLFW